MPWLAGDSNRVLEKPLVKLDSRHTTKEKGLKIEISAPADTIKARAFVIYEFNLNDTMNDKNDGRNIFKIVPAGNGTASLELPPIPPDKWYAISYIDRANDESELEFLK